MWLCSMHHLVFYDLVEVLMLDLVMDFFICDTYPYFASCICVLLYDQWWYYINTVIVLQFSVIDLLINILEV